MRILPLLLLAVLLGGCMGSRFDMDFRGKVASNTTSITIPPGIIITETINYRPPAAAK